MAHTKSEIQKSRPKYYISMNFKSILASFVLIHVIEDSILLSIGRYLPVPAPFMYIIGIAFSVFLLSFLAKRIVKH